METKKKCGYCDAGRPLINSELGTKGISIHYPNQLIAYGFSSSFGSISNWLVTQINYCPMCGRKLGD